MMLAERLSSPTSRGGAARSVLRLQDLVEDRMSAEDTGLVAVELFESQSRLLRPVSVESVSRHVRRRIGDALVAGVDSSSRGIESPPADFVVGCVSITSWVSRAGGPLSYDWPEAHGAYRFSPGAGRPPFIYLLPNSPSAVDAARGLMYVSTANPAGDRFDEDYSIHQALDEMRVQLENWALSALAEAPQPPDGLHILVDGPVVHVARAAVETGGSRYSSSWRRLLEDRVEAVRLLERRGSTVIGVVKRVERSRLLAAARGVERLVSSCGVEYRGAGDRAVIDAALRMGCARWRPGSILVGPKLSVRVGGLASKIVEYVVVPPGRWQMGPGGARVFRLEYTPETLAALRERGMEPIHIFMADSVMRGSLEPITIALSDRRSSSITRGLRLLLASALRGRGVPLGYSTLVEMEGDSGWRAG